jgi:hyperosmotically inducible protein
MTRPILFALLMTLGTPSAISTALARPESDAGAAPATTSDEGRSLCTTASDAAITARVKSRLLSDPDVSGSRIDVDTKDKVVTLQGSVSSPAESTRAASLAASVDGVSAVSNRLRLATRDDRSPADGAAAGGAYGKESKAGDAMITAKVKTRLLADPDVAGLRIDVDTRDSVVTLTGTVASEDQAARALALASEVEGVSTVNNRLLPAR